MCGRRIPPEVTGFSQPTWRDTDPRQIMRLAVALKDRMHYVWDEADPPKALETPRAFEERASEITINYESNHDRWYLSEADIDNDGHPDSLMRYRSGRCNNYPPDSLSYAIPIAVIDSSGTKLDAQKTRQILGLTKDQSLAVTTQSFDHCCPDVEPRERAKFLI